MTSEWNMTFQFVATAHYKLATVPGLIGISSTFYFASDLSWLLIAVMGGYYNLLLCEESEKSYDIQLSLTGKVGNVMEIGSFASGDGWGPT